MRDGVMMPGCVKCVVVLSFLLAIGSHPTSAQKTSLIRKLDGMES
jgi:hypothetical protein